MIHLAECLFCLLLTIPPRPGEPAGRPPPEVAGRVPYPDRTVTFDQAGDWTVQADGVDASTWLTVAHPLWAPQSLAVRLNGAGGSLRLTPPAPVPLPAGWDTATVWYDLWNDTWRRTIAGPFAPRLVLLLRDETDETHAVPFPELRSAGVWRHWNLFQTPRNPPLWATPARLGDQGDVGQETAIAGTRSAQGGDRNGRLDGSSWLVGLTLVLAERELGEPITVYLDFLSFHTAPPAKPEVAPPVPGLLDQPLAPPADLPATARYDYRPIRGTLDDLIVDCGGRTFRPLAGGGVTFDQPVGPPERLEAKEAAGEWLSRWRYRAVGEEEIVTFRVRPRGGALIVEVDGTTGLANGLSFGAAEGLVAPRRVDIPYLALDGEAIFRCPQPYVLMDDAVFVSAMIDWHRSDASEWYGVSPELPPNVFNGGCRYLRLTDGRRRPLRETFYLAVSDRFEDVLPEIPHEPSPHRQVWGDRYYFITGSPYPGFLETNERFGLRNLMYCHHGTTWADIGRAYRMTAEVRPELAPLLPGYVRGIHERGNLFGMLMMYTGLTGLSPCWDEARVALQPDGSWQFDWFDLFAMDWAWTSAHHDRLEPLIHDRYATDLYYYDTHTARNPARAVDYRAQSELGGTARAVWSSTARIFGQTRANGRMSISEGRRRWLYAGLGDAEYGTLEGTGIPAERAPLVDFDLRRLHPLGATIGHLNFYGYHQSGPPENHPSRTGDGFDQLRAFEIAFGHGSFQSGVPLGDYSEMLKDVLLMQPIASSLLPAEVESIQYLDGTELVDTSTALRRDLVRDGCLRITYQRGLTVWVNYHPSRDWTVATGQASYLLPPYGWLVAGPDLFACAARVEGRLLEYVATPAYVFADASGPLTFRGLTLDGAAVVYRGEELRILPTGGYGRLQCGSQLGREPYQAPRFDQIAPQRGCAELGLVRARFGLGEGPLHLTVLGDDGRVLRRETMPAGENLVLHPDDAGSEYRIR